MYCGFHTPFIIDCLTLKYNHFINFQTDIPKEPSSHNTMCSSNRKHYKGAIDNSGNIIDGLHRFGNNTKWYTIDTTMDKYILEVGK